MRKVVRRWEEEQLGLKDRSRKPRSSPHKTSAAVEGMIIALRNKTGYGKDRITILLRQKRNKKDTVECPLFILFHFI